jgi:hypothetical protein
METAYCAISRETGCIASVSIVPFRAYDLEFADCYEMACTPRLYSAAFHKLIMIGHTKMWAFDMDLRVINADGVETVDFNW